MNQYLITAYDYTDEGALQRRMAVRPHHLDLAKDLKEKGSYLTGGAILNECNDMIGSVMILQFDSEEGLDAWQRSEPYILQKVWETVDIKPFRLAQVQ